MKFISTALLCSLLISVVAQEESVNPGINDNFKNPDPSTFVERFEAEGREVYDNQKTIVKQLDLKPGMSVADVGAGTGLFTRLLAPEVGPAGKVYAVDIAGAFVNHTVMSSHARGLKQVEGVVCTAEDTLLPENSVDLVFICDTYHHFEYPAKTMASIHRALKPGGRLAVIDFERIDGVSSDWIMGHLRAGKEVFRAEIEAARFELDEEFDLFEENYFLIFRKAE
ncbi:MAG: methyltransferase domain-containing protein [Verrucomicrobiales bacterium]|nr:methyltransferase domain-containing protein [Verrucomicrobiales bacterium]